MSIIIQCSSCERRLKVSDKSAGKTLKCPGCGEPVQVIAPEETPANTDYGDDEWSGLSDDDDVPFAAAPVKKKSTPAAPKTPAEPPKKPESVAPKSDGNTANRNAWLVPVLFGISGILVGAIVTWATTPEAQNEPPVVEGTRVTPSTNSNEVTPSRAEESTGTVAVSDRQPQTTSQASIGEPESPIAAVKDMKELLAANKYELFVTKYAPIETVREFRSSAQRDTVTTRLASPALAELISGLQAGNVSLDDTKQVATVRPASGGASGESGATQGYGNDLKKTLAAGVADLEGDRIKEFVNKMLPPQAIRLMTNGPAGKTRLDMLSKDSLLVSRMLDDLRLLQKLTPEIKDDVAEYVVAAQIFPAPQNAQIRPNPNGLKPPGRRIRFSLIDGDWRFYAGVSAEQVAASVSDSTQPSITLELVGESWRLVSLPAL